MAIKFKGDTTVAIINSIKKADVDTVYRCFDSGVLLSNEVINHGDFVSWDGTKWIKRSDLGYLIGDYGSVPSEIVYFDVNPSDPPSGLYNDIGTALSSNKLPAIRSDGKLYLYTSTGTDKYVFVGGFTKESVGYTEIEVSDDDSVTPKSVDDKVFNMYMLYRTDPASPGDPPGTGDQPGAGYWICDENKHVITKTELMAAHANCRYFVLNNDIEPDSNTRKYFASVTVISNSNIQILFSMIQTDDGSAAEFTEKLVMADSEGRLYVLRSYEIYLAGTNNAVLVSEPQNFDATQKAQGRANIGAASASDVTALQSQVSSLSDVSAYSVKGEATVAQLNAGPSGIQAGWAYQLTDSGTLTGGSLAVVAGDTVAWDGTKWFPLVKSDYYATKTYAQNLALSIAQSIDNGDYDALDIVMEESGQIKMFEKEHDSGDEVAVDELTDISLSDILKYLIKNSDRTIVFVDDVNNFTRVNDKFYASDGEHSSEYWRYYYKEVTAGERYNINTFCQQAAQCWFMLDDEDNVVKSAGILSGSVIVESNAGILIPRGVSKLVINNRSEAAYATSFFIKKAEFAGSTVSSDTSSKILSLDTNGVMQCINLIRELGLNFDFVTDSADWTKNENYFINSSKSTYSEGLTSNSNYDVYEIVGVSNGDKYKVKAVAGSVARLWTIYDASGNRIARSSDSSDFSVKEEEVTIPYGAYRICVNARKASGDISPVLKKYFAFLPANRINSGDSDNVNDKLWGKTIVFCGDSITRGGAIGDGGTTDDPAVPTYIRSGNSFNRVSSGVIKSYAYQIAERHAMTYYNDGISGSTMQGMQENSGFSLANGRYTTLPNNIDYLVIFFGWNDTAYGSLGTIDDNTNESYYGGYNVVIPYLQNKYPYAKICLVVPYGTDTGHRNAIRLLCNKWGLSCFDMYGAGTPLFFGKEEDVGVLSSVVTANKAKFLSDGTHPNVLGHKQIADMLEQHLMGI